MAVNNAIGLLYTHLGSVVQTFDSAIHWINHYPVDKYLGNQLRHSLDRIALSTFGKTGTWWIASYPVIALSNCSQFGKFLIYTREKSILSLTTVSKIGWNIFKLTTTLYKTRILFNILDD